MTKEEILAGESELLEFKRDVPEQSVKYIKTVVAFANGKGGMIVFGVDDKTHKIVGIKKSEVFQKADTIADTIFNSCEPKIRPSINLQEIDKRHIIVVTVPSGMQQPYYIKSMGITEGTFVRVAATTREAERYMLKELLLEGENESFDQQPAGKTVSKEEVENLCDKIYDFTAGTLSKKERAALRRPTVNQLISWKLLKKEGRSLVASNGFKLLQGTNEDFPDAKIQCAVFKGNVRGDFLKRQNMEGPLFEQIESAYQFVMRNLPIQSKVKGLFRHDTSLLPESAVREAIANAVCHRSYLIPRKVQVALYDDRLEVTSPGTLCRDITLEKMREGMSSVRNKGIAETFIYMRIVETWGSGIPNIFKAMQESGLPEPVMQDFHGDFRITLYWKRGLPKTTQKTTQKATQKTTQKTTQKISEMELKILEVIKENSGFSRNEIAEAIGDITPDGIKYHLSSLQKKRLLKRVGGRKEGYWKVLMQQLSADAKKAGSAEMTLDEINAEIAAARRGK